MNDQDRKLAGLILNCKPEDLKGITQRADGSLAVLAPNGMKFVFSPVELDNARDSFGLPYASTGSAGGRTSPSIGSADGRTSASTGSAGGQASASTGSAGGRTSASTGSAGGRTSPSMGSVDRRTSPSMGSADGGSTGSPTGRHITEKKRQKEGRL